MIRAKDAIATARSLVGTPYDELDCINLVKKVIRIAPGGDPKFTVAHVPALWASGDSGVSAKYKFLTRRWESISNPLPGLLAFKGKPLGLDHQPSHIGIVASTSEGRPTVIHSSSVYGRVVETPLTAKDGWTLLAEIKFIEPSLTAHDEKEESNMNEILYMAKVNDLVAGDSWLNIRAKTSRASKVLAHIPAGATVEVLEETNDRWLKVDYDGTIGYCYAKYLEKVEETNSEPEFTIVISDEAGNMFYPVGTFAVTVTPGKLID